MNIVENIIGGEELGEEWIIKEVEISLMSSWEVG